MAHVKSLISFHSNQSISSLGHQLCSCLYPALYYHFPFRLFLSISDSQKTTKLTNYFAGLLGKFQFGCKAATSCIALFSCKHRPDLVEDHRVVQVHHQSFGWIYICHGITWRAWAGKVRLTGRDYTALSRKYSQQTSPLFSPPTFFHHLYMWDVRSILI